MNDSEAWAQGMALTLADGLAKANALESRHTAAEKLLRAKSFDDARNFMKRAAQHGGVSVQTSKSYMVPQDPHRRVDLEVRGGTAFV